MTRILLALAVCLASSGCATLVNGSRQSVGINSSPSGATIKVDGGVVGKTPWTGKIERKGQAVIAVEKSGYDGYILTLQGESSGWVFGNIIWGLTGVLSTSTDYTSGGAYQYEPGSYQGGANSVLNICH